MMLDDLLDYLRKHKDASIYGARDAVKEFVDLAENAERFKFDELPLEPASEEDAILAGTQSGGLFRMPELTKDEWEFWHEGLVPIPATVCWYEFSVNGVVSGLLVMQEKTIGPEVFVQRVEFQTSKNKKPWIIIDGVWAMVTPDNCVRVTSNDAETTQALKERTKQFLDLNYGINPSFMIYLTLMINSKTTEVRKVKPDPSRNRLRRQLGKVPERSHTVVTIVPQRFIYQDDGSKPCNAGETKHRRLHWRRTHVRVYNRGQPDERKIVISRFLVGRRDLGEVTHEYRVKAVSNH